MPLAETVAPKAATKVMEPVHLTQAGKCVEDMAVAPDDKHAPDVLSSHEEALALGIFSAQRFQAYDQLTSAEEHAAGEQLGAGSLSGSSRHSVSCAGMGNHPATGSDAGSDALCGSARWENENAWMDEYRQGAVSRCICWLYTF